MQNTSKYQLSDRAQLTCLTTTQFKTSVISAGYALPLEYENAATAILPYLLRRGTERYPDLRAISSYLDELYGAQIDPFVRKIGDRIVIGFVAEAVDESVLPEDACVTRQVIRLLGDMLHSPAMKDGTFDPEVLQQEKNRPMISIGRFNCFLSGVPGLFSYIWKILPRTTPPSCFSSGFTAS